MIQSPQNKNKHYNIYFDIKLLNPFSRKKLWENKKNLKMEIVIIYFRDIN
jgi:hypothetical protein